VANPISVRVRLRYGDLDTFVERFAPNVTRGGIFLASKSPRPVGDVFPFEVVLASGVVALSGEGKVIWNKEYDPAEPQRPHGMGVQFTRVDPASRETLNRILRAKGGGQPSQPVRPLGAGAGVHTGTNGTAGATPKVPVDTSVDLASEYGVDETTLRLTVERYRSSGARAGEDEIENLLRPQPAEPPPTLAQALSDLPRLLDPAARRRTGAFRPLELLGAAKPPETPTNPAPNGTHEDPDKGKE
jgi:uncharacterized protein (TIGR02266 family)